MSKPIVVNKKVLETLIEDFKKVIESSKLFNGEVSFSKQLEGEKSTTKLTISEEANLKMKALVHTFKEEVAWHGTVFRSEDGNFVIEDVFVYPQEISSATVTTDQKKYQEWLYSLPDDIFNNLRMQGHSHVNMSTAPSGTDDSLYESIIKQLGDKDFYVFLILNKSGDMFINIYDMISNTLYETKDVEVIIKDSDFGIEKFLKKAEDVATTKPSVSYNYTSAYTAPTTSNKEDGAKKKSSVAEECFYSYKTKSVPGFEVEDCYGWYGYDEYGPLYNTGI